MSVASNWYGFIFWTALALAELSILVDWIYISHDNIFLFLFVKIGYLVLHPNIPFNSFTRTPASYKGYDLFFLTPWITWLYQFVLSHVVVVASYGTGATVHGCLTYTNYCGFNQLVSVLVKNENAENLLCLLFGKATIPKLVRSYAMEVRSSCARFHFWMWILWEWYL